MRLRAINISLADRLIERIDVQAAEEYTTRSDYIRRAILEKLKVDEAATDIGIDEVIKTAKRKRFKLTVQKHLKDETEQG